jgi:hypothetical protein
VLARPAAELVDLRGRSLPDTSVSGRTVRLEAIKPGNDGGSMVDSSLVLGE